MSQGKLFRLEPQTGDTIPAYPDKDYSKGFLQDTSREAFKGGTERRSNRRAQVYDAIKAAGRTGATCEQIADHIGAPLHSISGRISELKHKKMIIDSKRRRQTRAGMSARVYVLPGAD